MWDAEDFEFSKRGVGEDWLESLPNELKEKIESHHSEMFPKITNVPDWVENSPQAQAIFNHLGDASIEKIEDTSWYGLTIFEVDGEYWVAGMESDMEDALWEYFDEYDDYDLMDYFDGDGEFLVMNDERDFIDNEIESFLNNTTEDEMVEMVGKEDELEELDDSLSDLKSDLEDASEEEDEERIEELEAAIEGIKEDIDVLYAEARDTQEETLRDNWDDCLYYGPVECFVNEKGWFRNASQLYDSGLVYLERDDLINRMVSEEDYDAMLSYGYDEEQDDDGDWFYVFQIDY